MNVSELRESLKIEQRRKRRLKLLNRYLHGRPRGSLPHNTTMFIVGFWLFSLHLQHAKFNNKLDLTEN
jgi:hypothetical protein